MRDDRELEPSVLITTNTRGGIWNYTIDLAAALSQRGSRVALATLGTPPTAQQRRQARAVAPAGVFETTCRLEWMDDPWDDVQRSGEWLIDLEKLIKPDVVHLGSYVHAGLPWRAPTLVVAHGCALSWWAAVKKGPPPARLERYQAEVRRGLAAANLVVAPSRAMLASLERHYGAVPRASVILKGRDPSKLIEAAKEPLIFCATSLWDEGKNVAALASAARELPWPVFVAGESRGPSGDEAKLELRSARLLGQLDPTAVAIWLARASLFVLPARYEPFGLAALEAGMSGCALVLGDIPSLREIWEDAAVYVDPDDVDGLRTLLEDLAGDPTRRRVLAERTRARASAMTAGRMAEQYLQAYRNLTRGRPERPARDSEVTALTGRVP